jgi:type I restriction enzyme S subunit
MSKLDKLIEELCPDGVEYKSLKEIAVVSGAGVDKKINANEQPIKLLNYMDVYRNNYIDSSLDFMEVTASENKISQCNVLKGDVFITPTSEVLNDIGNAAVITEDLENVVYSYHIMRIRLKKRNFITSKYMGYIFESNYVQTQINRYAEGITIPLPPLPIQEEIVRILDNFTELTAELTARQKQYEYYRDEFFGRNFDRMVQKSQRDNVKLVSLHELGEFTRGKRFVRKDIKEVGVPCIHYGDLYTHYGTSAIETRWFLDKELASKMRFAEKNDQDY